MHPASHSPDQIVQAIFEKLKSVDRVLCTVESCTGGLIANLVTNVSGSSEAYWGSFITYDNSAKVDLGVSLSLIEKHGAVSREVAKELAEKGLSRAEKAQSRSVACIATTGIAGPSGGSLQKPVGLCFIGFAVSGKETVVQEFRAVNHPPSNRLEIKNQFALKALEILHNHV